MVAGIHYDSELPDLTRFDMHWIDLENWPRRRHFEMFQGVDMPHFNVVGELDVSHALAFCKTHSMSSFALILYLISRTANEMDNMRYRIRDGKVCLHTSVDPAFTVLGDDELYYHCRTRYQSDLLAFCDDVRQQIALSVKDKVLHTEPGVDDVIYLSCIPWVAFKGISHAMHMNPVDSIPRYYWGKYESHGDKTLMPFAVQVHHGVADGLHVGRQFQAMQAYLNQPEQLLT